MARTDKLARRVISQFRRPRGFAGRLAGWEMAMRSSNRKRNVWAVGLLDVRPEDRVLEIGFGPGIAIGEVARRACDGMVVGIDHSDVMVTAATRRNRRAVRCGRVVLRQGSAESLPAFDDRFDKILTVNSMQFWPDHQVTLRKLRGSLVPGGTIAIVRQPRGPGSANVTAEKAAAEIVDDLREAGFTQMRWESLKLKPPVVCVLGTSPG